MRKQAGHAANDTSGGTVAPLSLGSGGWREDGKHSREHLNVKSNGSNSICRVGAT